VREFLAMGGYGLYVWGSYAVFVLVLAIDCLAPLLARRRVLAELRGRIARQKSRVSESPSLP
jgi:heme exporter protein D